MINNNTSSSSDRSSSSSGCSGRGSVFLLRSASHGWSIRVPLLHVSCKDDTGILCFALCVCVFSACIVHCWSCLAFFSGKGFGYWHRSTGGAKAFRV